MELLLALALGAAAGWLVGRRRPPSPTENPRRAPEKRLSRRQREILASLPPDPPRRTIDDLMREEAAETGVDRIPDAGLPLAVRLNVWRRDRALLGAVAVGRLRFEIASGVEPEDASVDDVRLAVSGGAGEAREP